MARPFQWRNLAAGLITLTGLCLANGSFAQTPVGADAEQEQILQYLDKTTVWYRSVEALRTTPDNAREAVMVEDLQRSAVRVLADGFDYARAEAAVFNVADNSGDDADDADSNTNANAANASKLGAYTKTVGDQIAIIQQQIDNITHQLKTAPAAQRAALTKRRTNLQGELTLTQAQHDLLSKVKGFMLAAPSTTSDKSFLGSINNLEQSFPEIKRDKQGISIPPSNDDTAAVANDKSAAPADAEAKTATGDHADKDLRSDNGILSAIGDFFPLWRKRSEIDALMHATADLQKDNLQMRMTLRKDVQNTMSQGKKLVEDNGAPAPLKTDADASDDDNDTDKPTDFGSLTAHIKVISTSIVPLGEQSAALQETYTQLTEWRGLLSRDLASSLCRLIIRLAVLGVFIMIPLALSEVARRAIDRYIKDGRRRRQLRTLRRTVTSAIVCLIVFLSLFSEIGSFATYAGLLTAGMAVALQNVILSAFCYVFLLGRFGIRVGERVTIGVVTGEVIEVGLLRLYIMEIENHVPTGRVAVFPNLVFFQPGAFFKQIAGTNYGWHELVLTFNADTDQTLLRQKLLAAIGTVYADYQEEMKRQRAVFENATRLKVDVPRPEITMTITEKGVELTLRYPVEAGRETEVDKRVNDVVLAAIKKDERLKLVVPAAVTKDEEKG